MAATADERARIAAEIEATQRRLHATLGALEAKLSPREIAHDVVHALRQAVVDPQDGAKPMIETLKRNPIPAALIGVGLGWLWLSGLAQRRNDAVAGPLPDGRDPLLLGGLGLVAGALLGAIVPMTRREPEWLGDAHARLVDEADALGRAAMDRAWAVAEQAGRAALEAVTRELDEAVRVPRTNGADGAPH